MKRSDELAAPPAPGWRELVKFLAPSLAPFRWKIAGLFALMVFGSLLAYCEPLLQKSFINALSGLKRPEVWYCGAAALAVMGISRLCDTGSAVGQSALALKITLHIRKQLTRRLLDLPVAFFNCHGSGYLAGRVTRDFEEMQFLYSSGMMNFCSSALRLCGGVVLLFVLDWRVGLGVAAVLPLYWYAVRNFRMRHYRMGLAVSEASSGNLRTLSSTFSGIALVKSRAAESLRGRRIGREFEHLSTLRLRQFLIGNQFRVLLRLIPGVCRGGLLFFGVWMILEGRWTLGGLWAMNRLLDYVFAPSSQLCGGLIQMQSAVAAAARVMQLDRLLPEENLESGIEVEHLTGDVEFRHVAFEYVPGVPVLQDVSFRLKPAEMLGISGPSGSGKSTILALLLQFYRPHSGEIFVDGRNIGQYRLRSLRRRIGYIGQVCEFLDGTVAENLRMGAGKAVSDGQLSEVLARAGLGGRLGPEGAGTRIEERGMNFSGGERLRLAAARELLRDPDLLILDEPTANLDPAAERELLELFRELFRGRSILLISHRDSTLHYADRQLMLADGRVLTKPLKS